MLQVADEALVSELKLELKELEGIPVLQQVLVHAGKPLKDHLSLGDHQLNDFTLSDEVGE